MRIYFVLVAVLVFSYLLRSLGLRFFGHLGNGLGRLMYFLGIRKKVVLANIELAFPKFTPAEREEFAKKVYASNGTIFLELMRNFSFCTKTLIEELSVDEADIQLLDDMIARGQGGIFLSGHIANWELFAMGMSARGYPVAGVVKKQSNPISQALIEQRRESTGMHIIYSGNTLVKMAEALKQGKFIGFMADQHINGKRGIRANFFGVPAASIRGLAQIVKETGCPIFPMCGFRQPDGTHHVKLMPALPYLKAEDLPEGSKERELKEEWLNSQQYQSAIENLVRMHPEQWLWFHRRWKADRTPIKEGCGHLEQMNEKV